MYCAVYGCLSTYKKDGERKFYRFPTEETRRQQWIRAAGRNMDLDTKDPTKLYGTYRVCDLHFFPTDQCGHKLSRIAVPALNLPKLDFDFNEYHKNTKSIQTVCNVPTVSSSTQTLQETADDNPRKLGDEVNILKRQLKYLENRLQHTGGALAQLPPIAQKIIHFKNKYQGNRHDREYKMFAMNIYFASPLLYKYLAEALYLPSERTLRKTKMDIGTKLSENIINCLQSKINTLSESERVCVLCADEISLKSQLYYYINKDKITGFHEIGDVQYNEPATKAFVVMARGVFSKWKQPLAYCFLSQRKNYLELHTWLDDIIIKVIDIGFNVVAFTTDQGSNFLKMAKNKNVSSENPFFYVNGKKIYYIFDVPHLLKSLRNNLIKYDFIYQDFEGNGERVSWKDVEKFYNLDKENSYQMAYKLTDSHIRPNNIERMNVTLAAQVFSKCVATAIQVNVELKKLPKEALGTAKFLMLINNMFDILNSNSSDEDYKYKKPFSQKKYQMQVLDKVLNLLKNVRIVQKSNQKDVTNCIKCLKNLEITIHSVKNLFKDLKNQDHQFILTRRLNQDVLQFFFESIRQKSGSHRKPTPFQFAAAFNKHFLANAIRHSEYANCAEDFNKLLAAIEGTCSSNDSTEHSVNENALPVGTVDYRFDLPEENSLTYLCSYLLKKCNDIHGNCTLFQEYIDIKFEISANTLLNAKACTNIEPFFNPQENFKELVRQMDEVVRNVFKEDSALPLHVGNGLMKYIDAIPFRDCPCPCFPIVYVKRLFIRFRIFNIVTCNNRHFKDKLFQKKCLIVSPL